MGMEINSMHYFCKIVGPHLLNVYRQKLVADLEYTSRSFMQYRPVAKAIFICWTEMHLTTSLARKLMLNNCHV